MKIAVVIPTYKCRKHILNVIDQIGPEVARIFVVDDACPEETGRFVQDSSRDPRVEVIFHKQNLGVGGAVITGYLAAREAGYEIAVKVDGDGQMSPRLIPRFIAPILAGHADYTKGNRFYDIEGVSQMPRLRLIGNAGLSFLTKLSSGYWDVFDPTNGYTAIHIAALHGFPFGKVAKRFFFESDMLFRLNLMRAVVVDVPMESVYGDEVSNLKISQVLFDFSLRHGKNFGKRLFYNYFLRGFSVASLELTLGFPLFIFGVLFGAVSWIHALHTGVNTSSGTVMLAALPILIGVQLLLSFLGFDYATVPRRPISLDLKDRLEAFDGLK